MQKEEIGARRDLLVQPGSAVGFAAVGLCSADETMDGDIIVLF